MSAVDSDLRGLRLSRRLSVSMAAALSGVSKSTLLAWEGGTSRPRGSSLARHLNTLDVQPRVRARLLHEADPAFARIELAHSALGAPVDVGAVLRAMRARRGLTQSDLARRLGVTQGTVSQWEMGGSLPSPETIHAVGFSLRATVEETVALASVRDEGEAGIPDDPEVAHEWLRRSVQPGPIREVVSLGWEAELWRRAARDARWDGCLIRILADRANWLVGQERFDEIAAPARRAIRMVKTTEDRVVAAPAVAALADLDRRQGAGHAAAAEMAGARAARIPDSLYRAWMIRQRGMCVARMGRGDEGAALVRQSTEMDMEILCVRPEDRWLFHTQEGCEAYLAAREPVKAASLLNGKRDRRLSPQVFVRVEHANGRAARSPRRNPSPPPSLGRSKTASSSRKKPPSA